MGKKYIIELEDKPFHTDAEDVSFVDDKLWRVKGFRSLVFDPNGLDKLTEYAAIDQESAYKKGLEDAWNAARTIAGMSKYEMVECFGTLPLLRNEQADKMTPEEVIDKLKEFEQRQELSIGDEIIWRDGSKSVVIDRDDCFFTELDVNGCVSKQDINGGGYSKTGRHYDQIEKLLGALRR